MEEIKLIQQFNDNYLKYLKGYSGIFVPPKKSIHHSDSMYTNYMYAYLEGDYFIKNIF